MFPDYFDNKYNAVFKNERNKLISNKRNVEVINEIPRFIHNENYASAFGEQWKKYFDIQLDSYTNTNISRDRVKRCMGSELFEKLKGKYVLEAGCGAGRFTEVLLSKGARVASFDISDAVEANKKNFPLNEDHIIFQADINDIPFKAEQFDVVLCLGVIQHTPDPEQTIASLWNQVKPGGWLVIDHYTYRLSHFTKTTPIIRPFIKRLSPKYGIKVTDSITKLFFPLHKLVKNFYFGQALLSRISPVHTYFFAYPELSDVDQYNWALLDTHDSLTDWYKYFRTKGQIRKALQGLGGTEIYSEYSSHGVDARAKKKS